MHKGRIIAIAEERLNRRKYSDGYLNSFFYALNALGITANDVDLFVSSSYHKPLSEHYMGQLVALGVPEDKFITADHHLSHAYSTWSFAPFERALVVVIDGLGNNTDTESYYLAEGNALTKIGGNDAARSMYKGIGRAYESFTNFCGWSAQEAGKTMGLAPYGHDVAPEVELFDIDDQNRIGNRLEGKYYHGAVDFAEEHKLDFGKAFSGFENKNAAHFVQARLEKVVLEVVERLAKQYQVNNLCLAGGVFLNGIVNQKISDRTPIENIFVPPCCDDTGQALGNVLYGYHEYFKAPKSLSLPHAYLGREYTDEEILDVVERRQAIYTLPYETKSADFSYKKSVDIVSEVAGLLAKGEIVGWFQGASEVGPRALGHRSIICAPYPAEMKNILNHEIKHRESFRPFAPVVPEEEVGEYFETAEPSPFMLRVAMAKPEMRDKIPAVLHVDYSGRIQTLTKEANGRFYDLVKKFKEIAGVSVLLNTSFNDAGEPIVETPRDALNMFCKTPMKYLVLGDYLLWKDQK